MEKRVGGSFGTDNLDEPAEGSAELDPAEDYFEQLAAIKESLLEGIITSW